MDGRYFSPLPRLQNDMKPGACLGTPRIRHRRTLSPLLFSLAPGWAWARPTISYLARPWGEVASSPWGERGVPSFSWWPQELAFKVGIVIPRGDASPSVVSGVFFHTRRPSSSSLAPSGVGSICFPNPGRNCSRRKERKMKQQWGRFLLLHKS